MLEQLLPSSHTHSAILDISALHLKMDKCYKFAVGKSIDKCYLLPRSVAGGKVSAVHLHRDIC